MSPANDFSGLPKREFVTVEGSKITFLIQDGPIKEFGINGCQIDALLETWLDIVKQFNKNFPCRENSISITKVEEALLWQLKRKLDREARQVEGLDKQ